MLGAIVLLLVMLFHFDLLVLYQIADSDDESFTRERCFQTGLPY